MYKPIICSDLCQTLMNSAHFDVKPINLMDFGLKPIVVFRFEFKTNLFSRSGSRTNSWLLPQFFYGATADF